MGKRPKMMESLNIWIEDTSFIIDKLEELNKADDLFGGKLDLDKIGVVGHSFGGAVAGQMCFTDSRCKAGVNLDGLQIEDMLDKPLEKPFMLMHHDKKNVINNKLNKPFFNQSVNDACMHVIKGTTHFNFSDLSLPLYSKLLNPLKEMLGSIDGFRCLKIQNDYIRAFFDKYLSHLQKHQVRDEPV